MQIPLQSPSDVPHGYKVYDYWGKLMAIAESFGEAFFICKVIGGTTITEENGRVRYKDIAYSLN